MKNKCIYAVVSIEIAYHINFAHDSAEFPLIVALFQPVNMWFAHNDGIMGSREDRYSSTGSAATAVVQQQQCDNVGDHSERTTARHRSYRQSRGSERRK